jgi:hypothetical protein
MSKIIKHLSYDTDVRRNKVITLDGTRYKLLERCKDTFVSYIPDCDNEQEGVDSDGNYYDENCRVYCDEVWRAIDTKTKIETTVKVNSFFGFWYKILENEKKYSRISINEDSHTEWAKITE